MNGTRRRSDTAVPCSGREAAAVSRPRTCASRTRARSAGVRRHATVLPKAQSARCRELHDLQQADLSEVHGTVRLRLFASMQSQGEFAWN